MLVRRIAVFLFVALAAARTAGAGIDKESQKWLEDVTAIILPEEAKIYGQLKDRTERIEFEKIFWARRDPEPGTAENEFQKTFLTRKVQADERFKRPGLAGSATGCGRMLILMGEPDSIRKEEGDTNVDQHQIAMRVPEIWTYKDRGDIWFRGGEGTITVDRSCAVKPMMAASLTRLAETRVVNPGLTYKVVAGRITRLADLLPKATPAQEMLSSGRQDFALAAQIGYFRADGPTAVIGLVRAEGTGLSVQEAGGKKVADVVVVAHAVTDDGRVAAVDERPISAPVGTDGSVQAAYRLYLKAGHYTLKYGVLDPKSGKGAVASASADVPDLNGTDLSAGTLMVVQDIVEGAKSNPGDPLDGFVLGSLKLVPRFGNSFARSEAAHFFYTVNGSVDEAGKSNLSVGFSLLKGTQLVASTPSQTFTDPHVVTSVGPVDLRFEPGAYTARLKVKDNLTQKQTTVDQGFEIK
jgi:GWxTD domain-containing protein